jgi:hypothetical protein
MRPIAAFPVVSAILVFFSAAGLYETAHRTNSRLEASLCRFYICDTGSLIDRARSRRFEIGPQAAGLGATESLEALSRDPASAPLWSDAAEALLIAGHPLPAAYAVRRAVALAPLSPPILLHAANFFFATGNPAEALPLTARILHTVRDYDPVVFLAWDRSGLPLSKILATGLPPDPDAARSFFLHTLATASPDNAAAVWDWLASHHYAAPDLAARYADFLLDRRVFARALAFWSAFNGAPDFPRNRLFNPGFEAPFSGARLDWSSPPSPHAETRRDPGLSVAGNWSLRVAFDGTANLDYYGPSQTVIVAPGPLHFHAWLKLDSLTTDRGIFIRICDPESPSRLDLRTPALTGTREWTPLDLAFIVPPATGLLQVQLRREPSLKFDNKLAGTVWIDGLDLTPRL